MGQPKKGDTVKKDTIPPLTASEKEQLRTFLEEDVAQPMLGSMIAWARSEQSPNFGLDGEDFAAGIPVLRRTVDRSIEGNLTIGASDMDTLNNKLGIDKDTATHIAQEPDIGIATVKLMDYLDKNHLFLNELYFDGYFHFGCNLTPNDLLRLKDNWRIPFYRPAELNGYLFYQQPRTAYQMSTRDKPQLDAMIDHVIPKLEKDPQFRAYFKNRLTREKASYTAATQVHNQKSPPAVAPTQPTAPGGISPQGPGQPQPFTPSNQAIEDLFDARSTRAQQLRTWPETHYTASPMASIA